MKVSADWERLFSEYQRADDDVDAAVRSYAYPSDSGDYDVPLQRSLSRILREAGDARDVAYLALSAYVAKLESRCEETIG